MKRTISLLAAGAIAAASTIATAASPSGGGPMRPSTTTTTSTTAPGTGPAHTTGQPNQSCQTVNGGNTGPYYPGNTSNAPGSAFNENGGTAGSKYAGTQPQNSKNSAAVSQYDVACANQPK